MFKFFNSTLFRFDKHEFVTSNPGDIGSYSSSNAWHVLRYWVKNDAYDVLDSHLVVAPDPQSNLSTGSSKVQCNVVSMTMSRRRVSHDHLRFPIRAVWEVLWQCGAPLSSLYHWYAGSKPIAGSQNAFDRNNTNAVGRCVQPSVEYNQTWDAPTRPFRRLLSTLPSQISRTLALLTFCRPTIYLSVYEFAFDHKFEQIQMHR